jgi:hypothetical protein
VTACEALVTWKPLRRSSILVLTKATREMHEVPLLVPTRAADQPDPKRLESPFSQFLELST